MKVVDARQSPPSRLRLVGLYLVIAYSIAVIVPLPFGAIPRDSLGIGPFLLEGTQLLPALVATVIVWIVMICGLVSRRPWGRVLALFVFAGHVALLLAGALTSLSAWNHLIAIGLIKSSMVKGHAVIFRTMAWRLWLLVPSSLAFVYLAKRRDLFNANTSPASAVA